MDPTEPTPTALTWADVERMARALPEKTNLVVPRAALAVPPPHLPCRMGRPHGALRQYRCARRRQNLHIKEYRDRWVIHVDRWNPHHRLWRHIVVDHGFDRFLMWAPSRRPVPVPTDAAS